MRWRPQQVDRRVGVVEGRELAVGLVEQDGDVARDLRDEVGDRVVRQRRARRVVRVADDDHPRGDGDLPQHRLQVVLLALVERDADRPGARGRLEVRVDAEGGPGVDELGAGLEQRVAGGQEHVAGPVADRDARGGHAVAVAQRAPQRVVRRVRVAVEGPQRPGDRLDDRRQRRVRRLVRRELGDVLGDRVGRRGRVGRDAPDALAELEGHAPIVPYCAASRSSRSARASRRYTWRATWSSPA